MPASRAECGAASGAAEFGDVAGAAECWQAGCRRWLGAVSGVECQIRIAGFLQFTPVTRIKPLRTPDKCGLAPEVYGWWGLAQSST